MGLSLDNTYSYVPKPFQALYSGSSFLSLSPDYQLLWVDGFILIDISITHGLTHEYQHCLSFPQL
jgi:hypothetical protein